MIASIHSYIESISNPVGHFSALSGIFPVHDANGNILLSRLTESVNFRVEWRGEGYILKCFLDDKPETRNRARMISSLLETLNSPYIAQYLYLPQEMAVTSSSGISSLRDVVMQRVGDGVMLHDFLLDCCDRSQGRPIRTLLAHTASLARLMQDKGLVHRNIKPTNILVTRQNLPQLLNYDFAVHAPDEKPDLLRQDNLPFAHLALGLYAVACEPALYRHLGQQELFTPQTISKLAAAILASPSASEPLRQMARLTETADERETLCLAMERLAAEPASTDRLPAAIFETDPVEATAYEISLTPRLKPDLGEYDEVGETCEQFTRVCKNGRWMFIDIDGKTICDETYDSATDFEEGRATVVLYPFATMIDRQGRHLIPLVYDAVEWDAQSGTAAVSIDGKWGLYDRNGKQLTEVVYDWMSEFNEGMLLAKLGDKYGYLDREGQVAFDFIYDGASSFSQGEAPVDIRGKELILKL